MKFFSKYSASDILKDKILYKENAAANNRKLHDLLLKEQFNFCAYTEKYIQDLDSTEVEHFNSRKKYTDDYYNYYVVIRSANLYKKDEHYQKLYDRAESKFFDTLFFQNIELITSRILYQNNLFFEVNTTDKEAEQFIDFIGLNDNRLARQRKKHVDRIKETLQIANHLGNQEKIKEYFRNNKEELSFITALEAELNTDLSEFYT